MKKETLCCLSIDGSKRYELPAIYVGMHQDYALYIRPEPYIKHFTKNKTFLLSRPEMVLVSTTENHVISIALNKNKKLDNMYININLTPKRYVDGFYWKDLELDVKVNYSFDDEFSPFVVDYDEFLAHLQNEELRNLSKKEVTTIIKKIINKRFPFTNNDIEMLVNNFWPTLY